MLNSKEKAQIICKALDEKQGENIKLINISKISLLADYFIITSAKNQSQLQALIDNVELKTKENNINPCKIEGHKSYSWVLLDYNDVIVHIFDSESREYYNLEKMWSDGIEEKIEY